MPRKKITDNTEVSIIEKKNTLRLKHEEIKRITPLTENQKRFFDSYDKGSEFIMMLGSAGTGKTFIALYKIIDDILQKCSNGTKLIIIRSAVQSREIGYTPGSLEEKMSLYEQPYSSIIQSLFGRKDAYDRLKEMNKLEFVSTSFIRGCTFDHAIILVDETQNMNWEELYTVMTRVGNRSRIIFCGDFKQNDLYRKANDKSGLIKFLRVCKSSSFFNEIEFTNDDIVRSELVKQFLIAAENEK